MADGASRSFCCVADKERERERERSFLGGAGGEIALVSLLESDGISLGLQRMCNTCGFFFGLWARGGYPQRVPCAHAPPGLSRERHGGTRVDLRVRFDATEGQFPVGAFVNE